MRAYLIVLAFPLAGCVSIAKTAVDVVTLPVKAASAGVDAVTTSQSEADEKRGRALRKAEENYGKRQRAWARDCQKLQATGQPCPPAPAYVPPPEPR